MVTAAVRIESEHRLPPDYFGAQLYNLHPASAKELV